MARAKPYHRLRHLLAPLLRRSVSAVYEGRIVERDFHGYRIRFRVRPASSDIDYRIVVRKGHEPSVAEAILHHLKAGGSFLDIGANVGFFSVLASKHVGTEGQVVAFEPVAELAERALDNLVLNGANNTRLHRFACGSSPGKGVVHVDRENLGYSSLLRDVGHLDEVVEIVRVDDLVSSSIDVAKIDVEGYEYEVLMGMQTTIDRDLPILVIEFTPSFLEQHSPGESYRLLNYLAGRYRMSELSVKRKAPSPGFIEDIHAYISEVGLGQSVLLCTPRSG